MISMVDRKFERVRRHKRVRNKISGTTERPRLCVFRSNSNITVQIIDDVAGNTLCAASTLDKEIKEKHAKAKEQERKRGIRDSLLKTEKGPFK